MQLATFNPSRLTLARKRRGLTKTKLAQLVGVELRSISAYESGEFTPEEDRIRELARCLKFPQAFFIGEDLDELSPDDASFRALSKKTASQRDMALGAGAIALLINEWVEKRFELPPVNLPDLSREGEAEAAAEALRRLWGLGELPVKNTVHLLESKGVRVFSLSLNTRQVDAFSMWRGDIPYVFLNTTKSAEHGRFDAAHELGHLVMHRHGSPQGQDAEYQANAFASAFLMPRASVLAHAPRLTTVNQLIQLKRHWAVSVAALAYRLHTVGVLSDWHYRTLYKDISRLGYRTHEPEAIHRETSQVFEKVFAALREDKVSYGDIANDLHVSTHEIEQLVFGLAVIGLPGRSDRKAPMKRRNHLRAVT